jgi:hypothetical protein
MDEFEINESNLYIRVNPKVTKQQIELVKTIPRSSLKM